MHAVTIHKFGGPEVIVYDKVPQPQPGAGQVLVRVKAAGVGPWDALVREGKSGLSQKPPLILGSDLSGIVEAVGPDVTDFKAGEEVYGSTNEQFTGGYTQYALAWAKMLAPKPKTLTHISAGGASVVAVTAWQMLFEYAGAKAGQTVLIHGAGGSVGACAVQMSKNAALFVLATAGGADLEYARSLGAERVVDYKHASFEDLFKSADIVIDTVGGETQQRSLNVLKRGGILVSVVSQVSDDLQKRHGVRAAYFIVDVTTARLNKVTELFDAGKLALRVGTVLPLKEARVAHEMLAGAPHPSGKIVLNVAN